MKYRIIAIVKDVKGYCPIYRVKDSFIVEWFYIKSESSSNICIHALSSMLTLISAFIHGLSAKDLGIGSEDDIGYIQCPDPGPPYTKGGTVIFELRRLKI
ncbi:MAG: TIGR04076 family protein [Candidatus Methanomethylicia archaeon]